MIFKPVLIAKILAGEKTVTRRPVNGDKPCAYRVGQEYSLQPGMARPTVARISVASVVEQILDDIDDADAVLEGFTHAPAFLAYWRELYGSWDGFQPVYRIEFGLVEQTAAVCSCCHGKGVVGMTDVPERIGGSS